MESLMQRLEEATAALRQHCPQFPKVIIVLGSGLNDLINELEIEVSFAYGELPHVKSASTEGHTGRVIVGRLGGTRIACMQGRLHYYEGHDIQDVVFPYRVFARAGAEIFILTNAAGGLHSDMSPGDLILIRDHINLMGTNPLLGKNEDALGPRFPDMSRLYDPALNEMFLAAAGRCGVPLRTGVYIGIHGPSYETPAEIKMYRMLGADLVGMSTVPEAITVHHMGKRVVGISCVTNLAAGVTSAPLVHSEVLTNAKIAYAGFSRILSEVIPEISK